MTIQRLTIWLAIAAAGAMRAGVSLIGALGAGPAF